MSLYDEQMLSFYWKKDFKDWDNGSCFWHTVQLVTNIWPSKLEQHTKLIFDNFKNVSIHMSPPSWASGHLSMVLHFYIVCNWVLKLLNHFFQLFNTYDKDLIRGVKREALRQPKLWFSYFISLQSLSASKWVCTNLGNRMSCLRTMNDLDAQWDDIVFQFCRYQKSQLSTEISKAN